MQKLTVYQTTSNTTPASHPTFPFPRYRKLPLHMLSRIMYRVYITVIWPWRPRTHITKYCSVRFQWFETTDAN
jgi:hypothetical protein